MAGFYGIDSVVQHISLVYLLLLEILIYIFVMPDCHFSPPHVMISFIQKLAHLQMSYVYFITPVYLLFEAVQYYKYSGKFNTTDNFKMFIFNMHFQMDWTKLSPCAVMSTLDILQTLTVVFLI
jgi:hypothetical protein